MQKNRLLLILMLFVGVLGCCLFSTGNNEIILPTTEAGKPVGDKVIKEIGPAGGTLASADGRLTLIVPPNGLTETIPFSMSVIRKAKNMLNRAKTVDLSRPIATGLMVIVIGFNSVYGQSNKTPEGRVTSFYGWYLKSINNEQEPSKTVMNSHLSKRFSRWYYSKAGQNLDYDIFVNGQDWNEAWADHITIGEISMKRTTAVVNVTLGSPAHDWDMQLKVSLVKEGGTWKIDRVSLGSAPAQTAAKRPAFPSDLTRYVGEYPVKLMTVPWVRSTLKTLLGNRYSQFDDSISVQHQITKVGDFLLASGCLPHACTTNEAAFVIDLKNKRIHAVIYEKDERPQFFNEDKAPTPQILVDWVVELDGT